MAGSGQRATHVIPDRRRAVAAAAAGKNERPLRGVPSGGVIKPATTYFPAMQYHRRLGLNFCVRDGNRCCPKSVVTDKGRCRWWAAAADGRLGPPVRASRVDVGADRCSLE